MTRRHRIFLTCAAALCGCLCFAQRWDNYDDGDRKVHYTEGGPGGRVMVDEDTMSTAREVASHSTDAPVWTNPPGFEKDVFTFCRVRFVSGARGRSRGNWLTDFPDSDLNLSFRL